MNNFIIGLKRFFTNKNVVTIILVLVILGILYYGYSKSIKDQTNPVNVPVASQTIYERTKITDDYLEYKTVANSMLDENAITSYGLIEGKYTKVGVTIPKGSVFYNEWLIDGEELSGNWIESLDYEGGELGYYMSVDVESTLGNSVLPNTFIDIYMKTTDENGTVMFGKLLKNIKVLVVHDGSGKNVFGSGEEVGTPAKLGFGVVQDEYNLLHKIEYLDVELIIQPRGSSLPKDKCTDNCVVVASSTLRDYVDAQTITVDEDVIAEEKDENVSETNNVEKVQ